MAQLELLLERVASVRESDGWPILGHWVVGLGYDDRRVWDHAGGYRYFEAGEHQLRFAQLPHEMAERAVQLFAQTRALSPEHAPAYNCHTLPFALADRLDTGFRHRIDEYDHRLLEHGRAVSAPPFTAGAYYLLKAADGRPAHSFVALDPDTTLSILGNNQPFVVMSYPDLAAAYNTDRVVRYTPLATHLAAAKPSGGASV